jgi:hypothetical protein
VQRTRLTGLLEGQRRRSGARVPLPALNIAAESSCQHAGPPTRHGSPFSASSCRVQFRVCGRARRNSAEEFGLLLASSVLMHLPQAEPGATAIPIDEFDAGSF